MNLNKGFTFIEFLIAAAILGILASIALPAIDEANKKLEEQGMVRTDNRIKDTINMGMDKWDKALKEHEAEQRTKEMMQDDEFK